MIAPRPPDVVMRLARLGAAHPTRLSFLRSLIRCAQRERWRLRRARFALDDGGFGHAVYVVELPGRAFSLVAFSTPLDEARRTDRVIAEAWDTSFVLYDGEPDAGEIARLQANAPLQEAGRFTGRELVLARANKSVRQFGAVVAALACGAQPGAALAEVGYLLRTTAVYGNGKFGIADRGAFAEPFRAEMLTVWLIRAFSCDLVDHVAARMNPAAARLAPEWRERLGVGNATGLGMAPFLVRHPVLIHRWFDARETALARVRSLPEAAEAPAFLRALAAFRAGVEVWRTGDARQAQAIVALRGDLELLAAEAPALLRGPAPWDALYRFAEAHLSLEGQEACVALLLEPHGALIDDLAEDMQADEAQGQGLDGRMSCGAMRALLARGYGWAARFDFGDPAANARFWYVSADKLEPRLGERFEEEGAALEQPLATARDALGLASALAGEAEAAPLADFLLHQPQWRHVARRAQVLDRFPYAEIRDNLIDAEMRPIDILRAKLAFFGARRFDPRSDRWLRIALFAGEPTIETVCGGAA